MLSALISKTNREHANKKFPAECRKGLEVVAEEGAVRRLLLWPLERLIKHMLMQLILRNLKKG